MLIINLAIIAALTIFSLCKNVKLFAEYKSGDGIDKFGKIATDWMTIYTKFFSWMTNIGIWLFFLSILGTIILLVLAFMLWLSVTAPIWSFFNLLETYIANRLDKVDVGSSINGYRSHLLRDKVRSVIEPILNVFYGEKLV